MKILKNQGMTLLELILAMSMFSIVVGGGAAVNQSINFTSLMNRSDLQMRSTGAQILLAIEKDIMDFTQVPANQPARLSAQHTDTTSTLLILPPLTATTATGIAYTYEYTTIELATLTRSTTTFNGTLTGTPTVIYDNATAKGPMLLPFATLNENYGNTGVTVENIKIQGCAHGRSNSFSSDCRFAASGIKWVFDVASDGQIVYLSFRLDNKILASGKMAVSRGLTKTIYLRAQE